MFWKRKCSFATTNEGFILVITLIAVSVFLLFALETTSRITREVRVTRMNEHSEKALFAADAGFNRVRARALKGAHQQVCGTVDCIEVLNTVEDTLEDGTETFGTYQLSVTRTSPGTYAIVSTGIMGTGAFSAVRVVSGTITIDAGGLVTVAYEPGN